MRLEAQDMRRVAAGIPVHRWDFGEVDAVILSNPWCVGVNHGISGPAARMFQMLAGLLRAGWKRPAAEQMLMEILLPADTVRDRVAAGVTAAELADTHDVPVEAAEARLASLGLAVPPRRHLRLVVDGAA